ncbi:MAG: PIN domain-containing protein [Verrucomicrobia bacterium]|nr:PIN domain-containing protein [Verrucomicrobiota bacterium]
MNHLLDSGPLVAYLREDDEWHEWAVNKLNSLTGRFLTCDAVIAETAHLLRALPGGYDSLLAMIETGQLRVIPLFPAEATALRALRKKYGGRMDLADACLVRLTEKTPSCRVVTLDTDFQIYRRHGRAAIPLIAPFVT